MEDGEKGWGKLCMLELFGIFFQNITWVLPRPMEIGYPGKGNMHVWVNEPPWDIQLQPPAKITSYYAVVFSSVKYF